MILDLAPLRRHGHLQGQRNEDCSSSLPRCSPHATGKPLGQLTFPVPVVCPSQCCGLQGRRSAPRSAHGPSAEPERRTAEVRERSCQHRATPERPRRFRRGAAVNLRKPLAVGRARAKLPFGLHEPAGLGRQGRAAGGVAARLPPPRPAPGLRETLASGAARRKSPQLLQLTRPSATPRPDPRPRPHRLLRSLGVSSAEPALRPAAGVRQGRSQRQDQRLLLQRERGVTPGKTERACWSDVLRCAPTPHEAFWLVESDMGVELLTWPWNSAGALLESREYQWRVSGRDHLYRTRVPGVVTPPFFFCSAGNCGSVKTK